MSLQGDFWLALVFFVGALYVGPPAAYLVFSLCCGACRFDFAVKVIQTAASILVKVPAAAVLSYVAISVQAAWITFWILAFRGCLQEPAYVIGFMLFRYYQSTSKPGSRLIVV